MLLGENGCFFECAGLWLCCKKLSCIIYLLVGAEGGKTSGSLFRKRRKMVQAFFFEELLHTEGEDQIDVKSAATDGVCCQC